MTNRFAATLVLPACLLICGIAACGPDAPDTTPAVRITMPVDNQVLPGQAGKPVSVSFVVGGTDGQTMDTFKLEPSEVKKPNRGRVVAYIGSGNIQAVTVTSPVLVPDETMFDKAQNLILPGPLTLILRLQYNDGTDVIPQRQGAVTVTIQ